MPRRLGLLAAFGFVLVVAAAYGRTGPKQPAESWVYPGTKWVYASDDGGYELLVTSAEQKGDSRILHLEQSQDGKMTMTDTWGISSEGVYRTSLAGGEADNPAFLAKWPHKAGEKWVSRAELKGGITITQSFTTHNIEAVKVPAGTFQAIHVEFVLEATEERTVGAEYWFAPEVGIVKLRVQKGDGIVTHELKSFTLGKQ